MSSTDEKKSGNDLWDYLLIACIIVGGLIGLSVSNAGFILGLFGGGGIGYLLFNIFAPQSRKEAADAALQQFKERERGMEQQQIMNDLNRPPKIGPIGRFWNGVKNPGGLRTASTNRSGRRRK